jgi:hypothetical protein
MGMGVGETGDKFQSKKKHLTRVLENRSITNLEEKNYHWESKKSTQIFWVFPLKIWVFCSFLWFSENAFCKNILTSQQWWIWPAHFIPTVLNVFCPNVEWSVLVGDSTFVGDYATQERQNHVCARLTKIFQTLFFSHRGLNNRDSSSPRPKLFWELVLIVKNKKKLFRPILSWQIKF